MVVILGEQKLTLEDKVAKLQEEVSELEALQDMNDQLMESNAELEADLREELDMAMSATREVVFSFCFPHFALNRYFLGYERSGCRSGNYSGSRGHHKQISKFGSTITRSVTTIARAIGEGNE